MQLLTLGCRDLAPSTEGPHSPEILMLSSPQAEVVDSDLQQLRLLLQPLQQAPKAFNACSSAKPMWLSEAPQERVIGWIDKSRLAHGYTYPLH